MLVVLRHLPARARQEHGFGMVELLAAMTVMIVGLLAVFSMFEAGIIQIRRASTITTAAALADSEMEKFRAIKYESIGLDDAQTCPTTCTATADDTYKGDQSYRADTSPTTTLSAALGTTDTTITVASASAFPANAPFLVQIDNERLLVTVGGASTTNWTVKRGQDGTTAASHAAGTAAVTQRQRVHLVACGTAPCTNSVPTKYVPGADGKTYRVDTYVTWRSVTNSATPAASGRLHKLVTIVVRGNTSPFRTWARVSSAFDESTGL